MNLCGTAYIFSSLVGREKCMHSVHLKLRVQKEEKKGMRTLVRNNGCMTFSNFF
jgi:hypothetical protein